MQDTRLQGKQEDKMGRTMSRWNMFCGGLEYRFVGTFIRRRR